MVQFNVDDHLGACVLLESMVGIATTACIEGWHGHLCWSNDAGGRR